MFLAPLPVDAVVPELLDALRRVGAVVLTAPPGAGKTTRVPPAVLDAGLAGQGKIMVLQPRRLAARASARRIATERGGQVGDEVGYQVRFERRASSQTRLEIVTEGILLRHLHDDPFLERVGCVVFDEFHQRSLSSDLALAMVRRVRETVNPSLKIVVMSATLDAGPVAEYLGGCPIITSEGRLHPVEIEYAGDLEMRPVAERTAEAVRRVLRRTTGDVLVFLPGVGEIRKTARQLEDLGTREDLAVLPLYGDLPPEKQDEVLAPLDRRKVVLATNVAETSITIDGITAVVDTGLARSQHFDPQVGMDRLHLIRVSQAATDQRAGRAGRTRPGICLRLWPERTQHLRPVADEPEIRRLDMAGPVLQLRSWGERDLAAFPWFEAPAAAAVQQAELLLTRLGALDAHGEITELGHGMARLPVSPRLGRMLYEGHRLGHAEPVALAAAVLAERDPLRPSDEGFRRPPPVSSSDVLDRVAALEQFRDSDRSEFGTRHLNRSAARFALHAAAQLTRETKRAWRVPAAVSVSADEAVLRAVFAAFPDRLVRRRNPAGRSGRMVGGRGIRLADTSAVGSAELFVAVDVDRGESEAFVWLASSVERAWLPAERLQTRLEVEFETATHRVVARRRIYWEDLMLEQSPEPLPPPEELAKVLIAAAAADFDHVFPWNDPATADLVARVRWLGQAVPELGLPKLDAAELVAMLPSVAHGCRSFDELRKAHWLATIEASLTPEQQQALRHEAPERIEVPSGNRIKLEYEPGKAPVLAVRIQEMFGMLETPRLARGRVAVLLHLLGPNMRPQQVTDDLASFWSTTYQQVRKDLARRYPKHAWPTDPYKAQAQSRPKRKS